MADDTNDSTNDSNDDDSVDNFTQEGPVPQWAELPDYVQNDLTACGYDAAWFAGQSQVPVLRLTVLNLYVKLKGLTLWQFVTRERGALPGGLHFHCAAVSDLKAALQASDDFTDPQDSMDAWDSREKRAVGALHFKHFTGWPESQVQAHIDPRGLLLHSPLWWIMPVIPLGQMLAHAADPTGYTQVYKIRDLLLDQGWDPVPLIGKLGTRG